MDNREHQIWYAAFKRKDSRFDGRFFVGVTSTGIYCRPVCTAKMPKACNCIFYHTAAEAEQAGYRPCLSCRPELAPGHAPVDAASALAYKAARFINENCAMGENLEQTARCLGCSDRHLRRIFRKQFHVSPIQYLQTCRLLLAKNLLTNSQLSVLDIAMSAGFGSLRRFNDLFRKRYKLVPTDLRRQIAKKKAQNDHITVGLGYRPPYQWQKLLDFLSARAIPGVEMVRDDVYLRTVSLRTSEQELIKGWIGAELGEQHNLINVTISVSLLPVLPQVLARIRHLFDLDCDPAAVSETLECMNNIRPGLHVAGVRIPGCFDPFEMSVRAALGQQITVNGANTLAGRLARSYGSPMETGIEGLTHAFPLAEDLAATKSTPDNPLTALGITGKRAQTIVELAKAFVQGTLDFNYCLSPETEIEKLKAIPGLGPWTAHYIAMRTMGWPDVFLNTDHGIKKALAPFTEKEILTLSEKWRPWRSYATVNLWNSLLTKQ